MVQLFDNLAVNIYFFENTLRLSFSLNPHIPIECKNKKQFVLPNKLSFHFRNKAVINTRQQSVAQSSKFLVSKVQLDQFLLEIYFHNLEAEQIPLLEHIPHVLNILLRFLPLRVLEFHRVNVENRPLPAFHVNNSGFVVDPGHPPDYHVSHPAPVSLLEWLYLHQLPYDLQPSHCRRVNFTLVLVSSVAAQHIVLFAD